MEKFLENVANAEKMIMAADHMAYVTFPLIKDKRLLMKVLQETKNAVALCINAILQHEYVYKRINLHKDAKANFKTFIEKCAPNYRISKQEIDLVLELFDFIERHKESPFEFMKNDRIVILSEGMKPRTLTIEKAKEFLILAKTFLKKTRQSFLESR